MSDIEKYSSHYLFYVCVALHSLPNVFQERKLIINELRQRLQHTGNQQKAAEIAG